MNRGTELEKFVNSNREWAEKDIQLTQVFYLKQILDRTERTRRNTSTLITWLVVMPFIMGIFLAMILALVG